MDSENISKYWHYTVFYEGLQGIDHFWDTFDTLCEQYESIVEPMSDFYSNWLVYDSAIAYEMLYDFLSL